MLAGSNIQSGSALSMGTATALQVQDNAAVSAAATATLTSGTISFGKASTVTAANVAVQSNAAGGALNVTFGSGSGLSATSGNVSFNSGSAGAIQVTGGTLAASSLISVNGGVANALLNVQQATGTLSGSAANITVTSATGDLTMGALSGTNGNISVTANGGGVAVTADSKATADITVQAAGSNNITRTGGVLEAVNVSLTSGAGSIGGPGAGAIFTRATNLQANTDTTGTGNVYLNQNGAVNLQSSTAGDKFSLQIDTNITLNNPLSADNVEVITTNNGSINVAQAPTAPASIKLTAGGAGNISGTATLTTGNLTVTSGTGQIGGPGAGRLLMDAPQLTANTDGNVYLGNSNSTQFVGASKGGAIFDLTSAGQISSTTGSTVSAANLVLTSQNAGFNMAAAITGSSSIKLSAHDSILTGNFSGVLSTPQLTLISTNGSIGDAAGSSRMVVNAANLTLQASAAGQNVYVQSNAASTNIAGASSAGNLFDLSTAGNVTSSAGANVIANDINITTTGGGVALNGSLAAPNSINISAALDLDGANFAGVLSSKSVSLTSTTGSVGNLSGGNRVVVDALNVSANAAAAGQNVFIENRGASTAISADSKAGAVFNLLSSGGISSAAGNDISATDIVLTATNGGFSMSGALTAPNSITVTGSSDINNGSFSGVMTSKAVSVTSTAGSVGDPGGNARLQVDANNLAVNAKNAVFVQNIGTSTNIFQTSAAGTSFDLMSNGSVSSNAGADISGQSIAIVSTTGGLSFVGALNAPNSISLQAKASIVAGNFSSTLTSAAVNLTSTSGSIGDLTGSSRLVVNASSLTANAAAAGQNVFLQNTASSTTIQGSSAAGATFDLLSAGAIGSALGANISASDISLTASTGGISLNGALTGPNSITLSAQNSITASNFTAPLTSKSVNVTSTAGSIGDLPGNNPLVVNAASLTANAKASAQNVFLQNTNASTNIAGASGAGATFKLMSEGGISSSAGATVSASDISMTAATGGFNMNAGLSGSNSISLAAQNSIVSANFTAPLSSKFVNLTSTSGSIGDLAGGNRMVVDALNISANAAAAGQNVFLQDTAASTNVSSASSAGATFDLLSTGSITSSAGANITANDLILTSTSGGLSMGANVTAPGSITLSARNSIGAGSFNSTLTSNSISVTSTAGSVGDLTGNSRLVVSTSNLAVNASAPTQNVFVQNIGAATTISADSSAGAVFNLLSNGGVSSAAGSDVTASDISITSTNGGLSFAGALTASTSITLSAKNSIVAGNFASNLTSKAVSVTSTAGSIGDLAGNSRLVINTTNLTANAGATGQNVFISNTGTATTIEGASGAGATFNLLSDGGVSSTTAGSVTAQDISITASTGGLALGAALNAPGSITLSAENSIVQGNFVASLTSGTVNITSTAGSIGDMSGGNRLIVSATNISANAGASGQNVFVENKGASTTISADSKAGAVFNLLSAGTVNSAAGNDISANDIVLTSTNGGFSIAGAVTAPNSIAVTANSNISSASFAGALTSNTVRVTSTNGSIGDASGNTRMQVNASDLALNAKNAVFAQNTGASSNFVGASKAGSTFNLLSSGSVTSSAGADIAGQDIAITSTSGGFSFAGALDAPVSITLQGKASIVGANFSSTLTSATVNLTSTAGSVGDLVSGTRLAVNAANVSANASGANQNVYIQNNAASTTVSGASSAGATFDLTSPGTISSKTGADVTARDIVLTSSNGGFSLSSDLVAPNSITLTSRDSMVSGNFNSVLTSNRVNLTSTAGSIGDQPGGTRLTVNAPNLSANASAAGQNVFIKDAAATSNIVGPSAAGDAFDLLSNGGLTVAALTSGKSVNLATAVGSSAGIAFGASVTGTNSITVSADGAGNITRTAPLAVLTGNHVTLRSGTGNIGDAASPILTVAQQLTASTKGGSVYVTNAAPDLAVAASSGANIFQVLNTGNIRTTGVISADDVTFRNTAGDAGIQADDDVVASGKIVLAAIGTGNITQTAGQLRASRLELSSGSGSFGSNSRRLDTSVGTVTLNSGGSGYISEADSIVIDSSKMGQDVVMTVPGGVTTADNVTANKVILTTPSLSNNFDIKGTAVVQVESKGDVQVSGTGNIQSLGITLNSTSGGVTANQNRLDGPLTGTAGTSFSARASVGDVFGASIEARSGSIQLDAASGLVGTTTNARLTASADISLLGATGADVNDGSVLNAGRSAAGWGTAGMIQSANSVTSNGSIVIDNYRGGSGTGNVQIGNNVQFVAHGGATVGGVTKLGNIGIASSKTGSVFADGNNISFTSYGGWIWVSGGDDVTFGDGARFMSAAHLDDNGGKQTIGGQSVPLYYGGGVGIYAGMSGLDIVGALQGMTLTRVPDSKVQWPAGGVVDDKTNTFSTLGGGTFSITLSTAGSNMANIHGNVATANGGIIVLDPPTPGNAVVMNNANVLALAPTIGLVPVPVCLNCGVTSTSPTGSEPPGAGPTVVVPVVSLSPEKPSSTVAYQNDNTPRHVGVNHRELKLLCQVPLKLEPAKEQEISWVIVATDCQSIELASGNIVAAAGTRVASDHGKVRLGEGRMVLFSDKDITTVATDEGIVRVPARSAAVLSRSDKGVLRIANLDGEDIEFRPASAGPLSTAIKANSEQEIVISGAGLDDEELIPTDGVPRASLISAKLIVPGLKAAQNSFRLKDFMQADQLLKCESCYKDDLLRRIQNLRDKAGLAKNWNDSPQPRGPKISLVSPTLQTVLSNRPLYDSIGIRPSELSHAKQSQYSQPAEQPDHEDEQLKPIAFLAPSLVSAPAGLRTLSTNSALILHKTPGKVLQTGDLLHVLSGGDAIVHARKQTVIRVSGSLVKMSAGTAVHVKLRDDCLVVRNLLDAKLGGVEVVSGDKSVAVRVGMEAIYATSDSTPAQLLSKEPLGRRRILNSKLNGRHLIQSEVSLVSMVGNCDLLQSLFQSSSSEHKDLSSKLLKTAACLGLVTASHGTYTTGKGP